MFGLLLLHPINVMLFVLLMVAFLYCGQRYSCNIINYLCVFSIKFLSGLARKELYSSFICEICLRMFSLKFIFELLPMSAFILFYWVAKKGLHSSLASTSDSGVNYPFQIIITQNLFYYEQINANIAICIIVLVNIKTS